MKVVMKFLQGEIMDLWEVAYDMDSFVCLFNREGVVSRNYLQ